jgi:dolichyl-phosphate beta-glucosyltransferase
LTRLARFLRETGWLAEVLVVDDGSEDGTSEAAARWRSYFDHHYVLRHAVRKGRGITVRTGVLLARGRNVVIFDPEGDTPLEDAWDLVGEVERGADLAIASRYVPGSEVQVAGSFIERASETTFNALSKLLVPIGSRDTNCDLIAVRRHPARQIAQRARVRGAAWGYEWLALATRMGLHMAEVPVSAIEDDDGERRGRPNELAMLREVFGLRRRLGKDHGPTVKTAHDLLHETGFTRVDRRVVVARRDSKPRRRRSLR